MNLIFFNDEKGEPHGGFPEPLRSKILKGLSPISGRPGQHLAPLNFIQLKDELIEKHTSPISDTDVISAAMYPKVCDDYIKFREEFGPVALLDTRIFLTGPKVGEEFEVRNHYSCHYQMLLMINFEFEPQVVLEKGKTLHIKTLAVSEIRSKTGEREVFFELNGQLRTVLVKDKTVKQVKIEFFFLIFQYVKSVILCFIHRKSFRILKH